MVILPSRYEKISVLTATININMNKLLKTKGQENISVKLNPFEHDHTTYATLKISSDFIYFYKN